MTEFDIRLTNFEAHITSIETHLTRIVERQTIIEAGTVQKTVNKKRSVKITDLK